MKMISSTSVMSTSGVTLMSTIIRPESSSLPYPVLPATAYPSTLDLVTLAVAALALAAEPDRQPRQQQVRHGVDARHGPAHPPLEEVVGDDRRDRDQQPDRRRHQRLGDAAHDRAGAAGPGCARDRRTP